MSNAIDIFYYIFTQFINFFFNSYILEGVSLGWVVITCIIFGILIRSVLNIPHGLISSAENKKATLEYRDEVRSRWKD